MQKKQKVIVFTLCAVSLLLAGLAAFFVLGGNGNEHGYSSTYSNEQSVAETTAETQATTPPETTESIQTTPKPLPDAVQTVSDLDGLNKLLADSEFMGLPEKTIVLEGTVELVEDIHIDTAINFVITGEIYNWYSIYIQTNEATTINITFAEDCIATHYMFNIDAPESKLVWLGNQPDIEYVATKMNVAYYNGESMEDYSLGGKGTSKINSFAALLKDNPSLQHDMYWTIDGNLISGTATYAVNTDTLKSAVPFVDTSGDVSFEGDGVNADGTINLLTGVTCVVTDESGNKRSYSVTTSIPTYKLPIVNITSSTAQGSITKDNYTACKIEIDGANSGFESLKATSAGIKGRGHSTWKWDKKPYKIKFNEKVSVLGLGAAKKWTLLANYVDESLIRNYVALEMGKVCDNMRFTSTQYPVDVFYNGEYIGVYSIGEQIEVKGTRVDIDKDSEEADTGYLLEVGGSENGVDICGVDYFNTEHPDHITIESPENQNAAQFNYIKDYVNKADVAISTLTDYEKYIDVDSFIDWFIVSELCYNLDSSFNRSCFMIKEKGGKLEMGPIWDFDLALGNFVSDHNDYHNWASWGSDDEDAYISTTWMNFLLKDKSFCSKLKTRWDEIKDRLLNTAISKIDDMSAKVSPSADANFVVWDTLGEKTGFQSYQTAYLTTYSQQISYLKNFIYNRYSWMDENIK